jgi:galactokinase
MTALCELNERFRARFPAVPRVFRAPGRVNLIGEHTDYNDGWVLPAAIGLYCRLAIGERPDAILGLYSAEFPGKGVELDSRTLQPRRDWTDYPAGVAWKLRQAGFDVPGANLLFESEVPIGAGLSSSAAIEVATALALTVAARNLVDRVGLAGLCQQAENEFVGAQCGIMDQFISFMGRRNCALLLDCRSLEYRYAEIPETVRLLVCNTMVKHELAATEYNERRRECQQAVDLLSAGRPGIRALRDVSIGELDENQKRLPEVIYRRAKHVVTENARVLDAAEALSKGDLLRFGRRMAESHESLRDLYQVSCRELDLMVELANRQPGCIGARMTGGGFGGSTINLVRAEDVPLFVAGVRRLYEQETGVCPDIWVCTAVDGAEEIA